MSFAIPLAAPLGATEVHFINSETGKEITPEEEGEEVAQTACPGTAAAPTAEPGNLCVYRAVGINVKFIGIGNAGALLNGAATAGALLGLEASTAGLHLAFGTWAVTAE
jgi:hypothetical protein